MRGYMSCVRAALAVCMPWAVCGWDCFGVLPSLLCSGAAGDPRDAGDPRERAAAQPGQLRDFFGGRHNDCILLISNTWAQSVENRVCEREG